jgi:hypothetical protein
MKKMKPPSSDIGLKLGSGFSFSRDWKSRSCKKIMQREKNGNPNTWIASEAPSTHAFRCVSYRGT